MKTLVCAIGRRENHYIREWVEHYKNIGFTNICLFDNNYDGEDDFHDVIGDYIDSGYVILKDYRNETNMQLEAYNECYDTYGKDYDWIAFFDCDEFLTIHNDLSIEDILSKEIYNDFDVVCPCWLNFDDNGLVEVKDEDYSIKRFTHSIDIDKNVVKSIVRGRLADVSFTKAETTNPHGMWNCDLKACNTLGQSIDYNDAADYISNIPSYEYMQLNHYRYRTIEEFIEKVTRGYPDGNHAPINLVWFFRYNQKTVEKILKFRQMMEPYTSGLTSAVCCIGKNENKYIREWIEHYKKLGFTNIFIYDNNDIDGERFESELQDYIDSGFVKIIDYRGKKSCQLEAYQDCYDKNKDNYNWIAFFDCDEFLHFSDGNSMLTYMLSKFLDNYDLIHVNWALYGDNGKLSIEKNKLQETLPKCLPFDLKTIYDFPQNNHVKSIIKGKGCSCKVEWLNNPHTPSNFAGKCCMLSGIPGDASSPFAKFSPAAGYLSHYQFKTVDDLTKKLERGYPDQSINDINEWVHKQIKEFFMCNKKTNEKVKVLNDWIESYNSGHDNKIKLIDEDIPLVSIIMPCYNMEKYIAEAIASVKEQLYKNIECIIVNDGSTDNSENIILDLIRNDKRFKYVYQSNAGVCVARNTAAKLAAGKYLIPLDPDDILMNYYISDAVKVMENDSEIALVAPDAIWFGTIGGQRIGLAYTDYKNELDINSILNSSLMRKKDFDAIGGYNIKATRSEDWDLWIRLLYKDKKVYRYKEIGYLYRSSGNSRGTAEAEDPKTTLRQIVNNNKTIYKEFGYL